MDLRLENRLAVVTGASAGIGEATARSLAREGCKLVLVARRRALLEDLAEELGQSGGPTPLIVVGDVTQPSTSREVEEVVRSSGSEALDILINSAGGSRALASLDADEHEWAESFAINFEAARQMTHRLLQLIRDSGHGRIINVTGSSEPKRFNAANAPKAALHVWAKALSRALAKEGITVNSVAPGRILTEQVLEKVYPDPEDRRIFAEAEIPIGHFGEPEEVANLITFLASDLASYITGEIIHVDGGMRRFAF